MWSISTFTMHLQRIWCICAAEHGERLPWLPSFCQFLLKRAESDTILSDFSNSFSHQPGEDFPLQDSGEMFQLNLIGATSNPDVTNKQNYPPGRHSATLFINSHFLMSKKSLWLRLIRGNCYKDCRMLA